MGVGVSAEPGMCCALGAEEYLVRASVKVAARGDGAAIPVPVPGRSFFFRVVASSRVLWLVQTLGVFGMYVGSALLLRE